MQGTPISVAVLCGRRGGAPDAGRLASPPSTTRTGSGASRESCRISWRSTSTRRCRTRCRVRPDAGQERNHPDGEIAGQRPYLAFFSVGKGRSGRTGALTSAIRISLSRMPPSITLAVSRPLDSLYRHRPQELQRRYPVAMRSRWTLVSSIRTASEAQFCGGPKPAAV